MNNIYIMYGAPNSGKTSTAKELEGSYIDFNTYSLYFDYPTIKVLSDKGLVIDGDIQTNKQLNLLLTKLVNHKGIKNYINSDGTYRIIIYYFNTDVDGNTYDLEYPNPQIPILSVKDSEVKDEMDTRPNWLKGVYKLRRIHGSGVSYLDKITSTRPYLCGEGSLDDTHPFVELTDMLVKINPNMPISIYKEIEFYVQGEVRVQPTYEDYSVDTDWHINLQEIAHLIPEWNND